MLRQIDFGFILLVAAKRVILKIFVPTATFSIESVSSAPQ
jgi:hypothetical protein